MATYVELMSKWSANADKQAEINDSYEGHGIPRLAADQIRAIAAVDHADYPQYDGHWDGWRLCRITSDIKTKGGHAFTKGDLAICNDPGFLFPGERTVYSIRLGCDVRLDWAVQVIETGGRD